MTHKKLFGFNLLGTSVVIISFLFILSCKTKEVPTNERVDFKEVMKWHDEAMAEMGRMYELKKEINELLPELDSVESTQGKDIILSLTKADEGMMDWMADFKVPEQAKEEEKKAFFESELSKVKIVHEDIFTSIKEAEDYIKEYQDEE